MFVDDPLWIRDKILLNLEVTMNVKLLNCAVSNDRDRKIPKDSFIIQSTQETIKVEAGLF
jgi:hypothetical protein